MNWANVLRRWTMRSIHATILGSALLGSASIAVAQAPITSTAANLPGVNYTRSQSFNLPVKMDKNDRAQLSEIRLYVKTPTTGWALMDKGGPELTEFRCKATQDGEYWYTLALVDRAGRMSPADVNLEPPQQRVAIDTTLPVIQVQASSADGDFCIRCTVQDANPDHASLKAVCRTDKGDLPLGIVLGQPGAFRVQGADMMRFPIVVSVRDLAGNVGTKEINLKDMLGAALSPAPMPKTPTPIVQTVDHPEIKVVPPPPPREEFVAPRGVLPTPPILKSDPPMGPLQVTKVDAPPPPVLPLPGGQGATTLPPPRGTKEAAGAVQLISTTRAKVEYRIDQVGPSGVGKVEIFMTPDQGLTWHRLHEHMGKQTAAEIALPGDGVFGVRVVVTNGNGFGGKAPVRGDAPHYTIEVDTTAPFVQLRSPELVPSTGHVEIRWNATDKNLGAEPVSLFYRTSADGPWKDIARGVKNDGLHRWAFPRDAGSQFFFKVEVTDQAGNMAQHSSTQPIVIDMTEPRATVVGITGAGAATRP